MTARHRRRQSPVTRSNRTFCSRLSTSKSSTWPLSSPACPQLSGPRASLAGLLMVRGRLFSWRMMQVHDSALKGAHTEGNLRQFCNPARLMFSVESIAKLTGSMSGFGRFGFREKGYGMQARASWTCDADNWRHSPASIAQASNVSHPFTAAQPAPTWRATYAPDASPGCRSEGDGLSQGARVTHPCQTSSARMRSMWICGLDVMLRRLTN
jgi:hypothetical protein